MLLNVIDAVVLTLCLPFYAILIPLVALYELVVVRVRVVRVGVRVSRWVAPDIREELLVVDVERLGDGIVGVRRRRWNLLRHRGEPPPLSERVEFCTVADLWLGSNRLLRRRGGAGSTRP